MWKFIIQYPCLSYPACYLPLPAPVRGLSRLQIAHSRSPQYSSSLLASACACVGLWFPSTIDFQWVCEVLYNFITVLLYLQIFLYLFVWGHLQSPSLYSSSLLASACACVGLWFPSTIDFQWVCEVLYNFITVLFYLQDSLDLFVRGHLQSPSITMAINFKLILGIIGIISLRYHHASFSIPASNYPFLKIL